MGGNAQQGQTSDVDVWVAIYLCWHK